MRIAIVAPSCTFDPGVAERLLPLVDDHFGAGALDLVVHPQCYLSRGHFAGPDDTRIDALVEVANDPDFDAIWFARGGYGACRVAEPAVARFSSCAADKLYMGYSDAGFLLAGLKAQGIGRIAHGPMPSDLKRAGGETAVIRALDWFLSPVLPQRPTAAFNLTVLSQLIGTSLQPDLTDHVLMIEDIAEYMYRLDRSLFHITSNSGIRRVAGLMLGRFSDVPDNDPDFGMDEVAIAQHWCAQSGIAYLGRADIGHDADNKVIAFL